MPEPDFKESINEIADKIKEGEITPFIGAGACQRPDGNCPPVGAKLSRILAKRLQYSSNGSSPLGDISLSTIAQHFQLQNGRDELVTLLIREIAQQTFLPSSIHIGLVKISKSIPEIDLVITTNYDTLLEKAANDENKECQVLVQYPDRPNDQIDYEFRDNCLSIYKMHGSFDELGRPKERDSLVITDDDYIEFLASMQQRSFIPYSILPRLSNRHFLFLGYSLQDWNFMVLYKSVVESKHGGKIKKSYTIQKPFESKQQNGEYRKRYWENTKAYWREKNIHAIETDQTEFMTALLERLEL